MTVFSAEEKTAIARMLEEGAWDRAACRIEELLIPEGSSAADRLWMLDNLGYAYYRLGRPSDALTCCRRALELAPEHAYAFKGQGVCLAALGQVDEGIASLLQAIQCEPNFFDAYHDLAVVLLQSGHPDKAKPWAQRAYQLDPVRGESLVRRFP
jgi:superkiller protein 3